MAADGTLYSAVDLECGPGLTIVPLDSSHATGCSGDPWNPESSTALAQTSADGSSIEDRLIDLENAPLFEVVDKQGQPIFMVLPCEFAMVNQQGKWVITGNAETNGGYLWEENSDGAEISVGASGERAGVLINGESGASRVEFGRRPAGNYSLFFNSLSPAPKAAIGESQAGSGALLIGDDGGRARALMSFINGKARVETQDAEDSGLLALTESENQAGMLVIGDKSGEVMAKFSTNNRYGAVLAGPVSGFPTVAGSGLPGSYILGCAGGAGCSPGGGGQRR